MKKKTGVICGILAAVLTGVALCGCGSPSYAEALFDSKNDYVGDVVSDTALLTQLGVDALGSYTLELQTDAEPYGMTICFATKPADVAQFNAAMEKNACVLLALIDNLSDVAWTYPENGKTVTQAFSYEMASNQVSDNIANFGASADAVQSLLDKLGIKQPESE